ncbi:MAG: CRISPR-associated exonuclease Cas4 [Archaeoglobi archaeon]|nr:CRISPR-associated exonuclease Cas4 [Archaeoglobi archaeon]
MRYVRVSDISLYLRCPRILYFVSNGHSLREKEDELLRRIFWKEVFSRYPLLPGEIDVSEIIEAILETHPYLSREDLEGFRGLKIPSSEDSSDPYKIDVELHSERLKMSGILDKIVFRDEPTPVILRLSKPPSQGIYRSDRLKLTAYSMLAEERFGRIRRGYVDYAPYGVLREHRIRFVDRKKIIRIRDKIISIYRGELPPRKEGCSGCEFSELCEVESSLLSDLFF